MSSNFERLAARIAIATGLTAFLYALMFVVDVATSDRSVKTVAALLLMLTGLFSSFVLVAVFGRLRAIDEGLALWAFILGEIAALGTAIHGGYDLANQINVPGNPVDTPNAVDPRGMVAFFVAALSFAVIGSLIRQGIPDFASAQHARYVTLPLPHRLGTVALWLAAFLSIVYVGRLTVLDPKNPLLLTSALVTGFVLTPLWYVWLGRALSSRTDGRSAESAR